VRQFFKIAAIAMLLGSGLPAQQAPSAKSTFLVVYKPGPRWLAGKPLAQQSLGAHGKYMLSLYMHGDLKIAGPFADDFGGAVILNAANEAEAKGIVMKDPAVVAGVFVYELHPWSLVDWESRAGAKK